MTSRILRLGAFLALFGGCTINQANWSYEGDTGPDHWGDLDSAWAIAREGKAQSPVDIQGVRAANVPDLRVDYGETPLDIALRRHTIEVQYEPGSFLSLAGEKYELDHFHFHSPSEHTIEGRHAAMEVHLVHKNEAGDSAVLAILVEPGAENRFLARFWPLLPREKGPALKYPDLILNVADFLPDDRTSYRYSGSLTMPPCSEGVEWILLRKAAEASRAQIEAFCAIVSGNNRPVQPLHGRRIHIGR